jgi:predicted nucleic acid-binding protein
MLINLDANVVIDLLDQKVDSKKTYELIDDNNCCVTPITVHIVWYFFDKNYIQCTKSRMLEFFDSIEVLAMSNKIYRKALTISKGDDIEDGMQIACCIENNVDMVITNDAPMYGKYAKKIDMKLLNEN